MRALKIILGVITGATVSYLAWSRTPEGRECRRMAQYARDDIARYHESHAMIDAYGSAVCPDYPPKEGR
jgi:hypothetical protein